MINQKDFDNYEDYEDREDYEELVRRMRHGAFRMAREGFCWSEAEKEYLALLFEDSVGITEIAVRLQRTEQAIIQQIEKQRLYERQETPSRRQRTKKEPACLCARCPFRDCCPILQSFFASGEGA